MRASRAICSGVMGSAGTWARVATIPVRAAFTISGGYGLRGCGGCTWSTRHQSLGASPLRRWPGWRSPPRGYAGRSAASTSRGSRGSPRSWATCGWSHRDRGSALWLDRDPIRWGGGGERGLAWSESPRPPGKAGSWSEAAGALDACGLVLRGRRRLVHSSAAGLPPVYWMDDGGATYFCSRIDPLVATAPGRLRPDWTAWAAIIRLGYAVGSRTPFEEVRRLEHSSTLERGPAGSVATVGRWPWAEEEPLSRRRGHRADGRGARGRARRRWRSGRSSSA